jgi:predicted thioesterase
MPENMSPMQKLHDELQSRELALKHLIDHPEDLTVKFLVKHELPVFVRNNVKTNAVILIDFKLADGRKKSFRVENTDIPQDISAVVPHKSIAESFHLDQSINNRTVVLVDPTKALEELRDPRKAAKAAKITASRFSKDSDVALPQSMRSEPAFETVNLTPGAPEQQIAASQVKDFLKALVLQYQEKTIDSDTLIDKVTDNSRSLKRADWLFLKTELHDNAEVQGLCTQQLSVAAE